MALTLSPNIQARIAEMVEHGDYPDADAVVERALDLLNDDEQYNELKRLIAVGVDEVAQGKVVEFTPERRDALWQAALEQAGPETPQGSSARS
jgi:Arc/MetJ-type ribon-helix-helix transcriptional regulator